MPVLLWGMGFKLVLVILVIQWLDVRWVLFLLLPLFIMQESGMRLCCKVLPIAILNTIKLCGFTGITYIRRYFLTQDFSFKRLIILTNPASCRVLFYVKYCYCRVL